MKNKLIKISVLLMIFIGIILCGNVNAAVEANFETIDYTDEYKEYMALSDEEKQKRLEPSMYDVIAPQTSSEYFRSINNLLNSPELLKNALDQDYDLRDIISNNVAIRDQMQTNSCWAFATIGSLESNIAILDYKAGTTGKTYDFSERHMDYAARNNVFNDSETNDYGYNVGFDKGGTYHMAQSYLTNGMGAINEEEMPFENNEDNINILEIQNKNTTTTLYDTIMFEDKDDIGVAELMSKMKQVISNYGGIYAGVHGAQLLSDVYNNQTGAIYCPPNAEGTYPMDHAVVIIGWDDTYSKDNFNEKNKPTNDGAWIVKNSWGEKLTEDLLTIKEQIYAEYTEECNSRGWNKAEDIDNDFIVQAYEASYGEGKVAVEGDKLVVNVGDNGYMYISYEDAHIYKELHAIEKATASKDYDNIYQNNKLHTSVPVTVSESDDIYIANKFTRNSSEENEAITMISLYTLQEITCKVYINSDSSDLAGLKEVALEAGDSIMLEPGYHTIMLKEPVILTGDSFAVAVSIQTGTGTQSFMIETKATDQNVEVNSNESFYTSTAGFEVNQWVDLNTYESEDVHGNVSIKAFTEDTNEEPEPETELTEIKITTPPNKITYAEGESFDKTGMVVSAVYSDGTEKAVTNYTIKDGNNLYYGQKAVTVSYTEDGITKETTQTITVNQSQTEEKRPILSNLDEMQTNLTEASIYAYEKIDAENYVDMTFEISNIKDRDEDTDYTYYYYLSENDSEENIEDWVELENVSITQNADGTYTMTFALDTREIVNYEELNEKNVADLYIYLKEVAKVNDESLEQTKTNLINTDNIELSFYKDNVYVDDIVIDTDNPILPPDSDGSGDTPVDDTVSPKPIPQTGIISIGILVVIVAAFGIYFYVRHKNIDK